ncbi:mannosyltransferase family protein [Kitasatospora sp. LaBMicrA B282]|uniref:mannosyltransferase family protein n=1 Tax=Kitasatospora sp. LaBMicrA B282 TaxID=3420949 RepID=UPI003D0A653B
MSTGLLESPLTAQPPPAPGPVPWVRRLAPGDREVLWLYLLTRVGIWTLAYCARWVFPGDGSARDPAPLLSPFERWDWNLYLDIARTGYFPGGSGPWKAGWDNREAFFPGFPLCLRAVHTVIPNWTAAGLLVSFVSGGVVVLALARIARNQLPDGGTDPGPHAVLFLLLSPCAVFLAIGYSEALFLAFALPAWLAAQRRDWPVAAVLAALATSVRVTGLFLAAAIALHFLLTVRAEAPGRRWRRLPWLLLPAQPVAVLFWYLHTHTGDWAAWDHAQQRGWHREFHTPWEAWLNTWHTAFGHGYPLSFAAAFQAELLAMLVGVAVLAVLVKQRRWPEGLYLALNLAALGTSFWYMSVPRATLLWWPLWTLLAARARKVPRFTVTYTALVAPLSVVIALTFLTGRWTG